LQIQFYDLLRTTIERGLCAQWNKVFLGHPSWEAMANQVRNRFFFKVDSPFLKLQEITESCQLIIIDTGCNYIHIIDYLLFFVPTDQDKKRKISLSTSRITEAENKSENNELKKGGDYCAFKEND